MSRRGQYLFAVPILLLVWFFVWINSAAAAGGPPITAGNISSGSSHWALDFSWKHTVSGDNPVLLVTVHTDGDYVKSVTYGGQDMTLAIKKIRDQSYNNLAVFVYYLANPALGENDLVVNVKYSGTPYVGTAITFNNCDTDNPIDSAVTFFDGYTPMIHPIVTTVPGAMLADAVTYNQPAFYTLTAGADQTKYFSDYRWGQTNDLWFGASYKLAEEAGTSTMSWQTPGNNSSVHAIVALNPKYVQSKIEPVIIVPGIMGSYLYSYIDPGMEVWPAIGKTVIDPWDFHLNQLVMDEQGSPLPNTMIVPPQDIIRSILNKDFFAGLIDELKQNGYEENKNLFVFPYDWRLDLNWSANGIPYSGFESLKDKVEAVRLQTGAPKVNIIAHSMGGLVAKDYIKHYGSGSVDKLIDIGTPHLGAPQALKILMYGDDLDFNYLGLGLNPERIKIISQNFPSVYQLLPSRDYFTDTDQDYAYYIYDMYDLDNNGATGRLDYTQSIEFMKNTGRNNYLLGYNNALHNDLDNYSPKSDGIKTYNIMGCGQPTIGQIFVLNKEKSGGYEYGLKYISGDGTVPLRSAEALAADDSYYIKGTEHAALPSANGVKQIAAAILKDTTDSFSLSDYPAISRNSAGCSLTGTQISFHSPIDLNVYDENNNHVGPNQSGDIEIGIAGAQYDNLDGNKFVFLPAGHNYRVVGQATASGSFNARVQTVASGQYTQTAYYNEVPLYSTSTVAKLEINNGHPNSAIEVDQNGDQTFETIVQPSAVLNQEEAADLAKPETQISLAGSLGGSGYYISTTTATLTAADDQSGSGILKIEYSLDNGQNWQNYQGPIIFSQDGEYNILYKSTDRAGNIEAEKAQKLRIDMTAPKINILLPLNTQEFARDEFFTPEYEITDNYSGVASSSLTVLVDSQLISQTQQDLFYYSLGEHILKITVLDLAGNQAETSVKFTVGADLDSAIYDVNRSDSLGWIKNKTVKTWLNGELNEIKKYEEKFGNRQNKLGQERKKFMDQCLKKKNRAWCEKRLKNYDKFVYKLNQIHVKIVAIHFQEILKQLEVYYKKQWLSKSAYDIIKADIKYLIINL